MSSTGSVRLLVVVPEAAPVRETVAAAFREAGDATGAGGGDVVVDFLTAPDVEGDVRDATHALSTPSSGGDRLTVRVTVTAAGRQPSVDVIFDALPDQPADRDEVRILVAPGSDDVLDRLRTEAGDRPWSIGRIPAPRDRRPLVHGDGLGRTLVTGILAFGFYLVLGDLSVFDVITGAVSAGVIALVLSSVVFVDGIHLRRTGGRLGRSLLYLPYLLWEIGRANVHVAAVILDPRLPIDPSFERIDARERTDLERAVLANSITLTPGTLAVADRGEELHVHALTDASRAGLRRGTLERAVGFVFHGRTGRGGGTDPAGEAGNGENRGGENGVNGGEGGPN